MNNRDSLHLVNARAEPDLALRSLRVDLGSLLATGRAVGMESALLLLTVRALSLRTGGAVPLPMLGWTLGATRRDLLRWLEGVERSGLGVWTGGEAGVTLEIVSSETERTLFGPDDAPGVVHAVPVFWFVRTLPLLGRDPFLVYLYLRSRERAGGLTAPLTVGMVQRACGLRFTWQATRALRAIRRSGLAAPGGGLGRFALADPPPLTRWQRRALDWRSSGALPPTRAGRVALAVSLALSLGVLSALLVILVLFLRSAL